MISRNLSIMQSKSDSSIVLTWHRCMSIASVAECLLSHKIYVSLIKLKCGMMFLGVVYSSIGVVYALKFDNIDISAYIVVISVVVVVFVVVVNVNVVVVIDIVVVVNVVVVAFIIAVL